MRTVVETADAQRLQIRTRILNPSVQPGSSLLQRAFVEFAVVYTRDNAPGQSFIDRITYKIADNGPNPDSAPLLTASGWTNQERNQLVSLLNKLKTTAESDLGF